MNQSWKSFVFFCILASACQQTNAQLHLLEDALPGSSSGAYDPILADDRLYYFRRNATYHTVPAFYEYTNDISIDCPDTADHDQLGHYAVNVVGNTLYYRMEDGTLWASDGEQSVPRLLFQSDADSYQQYITSCKNEQGDIFLMYSELTPDPTDVSYAQQFVIYKKPFDEDIVTRLGTVLTRYTDSFLGIFTATNHYIFIWSSYYSSSPKPLDCMNVETGETRDLQLETNLDQYNFSFQVSGEHLYLFDTYHLVKTNGDPGQSTELPLPENCLGVEMQQYDQFVLCGPYFLFKGIYNNDVVLYSLDTRDLQFTVIGQIPFDLYHAEFVPWQDGVCGIYSQIPGSVEVYYFDMKGNKQLIEHLDGPTYSDVHMFTNGTYVFWMLNNDLHSLRYSRLEPNSTFIATVPEYTYNSSFEFFPDPYGFYMRVKSTELGNELFRFRNPEPSYIYSSDIQISAYPNPAQHQINVQFGGFQKKVTLILQDAIGQNLFSFEVSNASSYELDLSHLNSGMYFVSVISEGTKQTLKLIKR